MRDVKQLGRARSRKNIMISSQARFADPSAPKTNNPGPGHYGTGMVYGNLLKQVGAQNMALKHTPYYLQRLLTVLTAAQVFLFTCCLRGIFNAL